MVRLFLDYKSMYYLSQDCRPSSSILVRYRNAYTIREIVNSTFQMPLSTLHILLGNVLIAKASTISARISNLRCQSSWDVNECHFPHARSSMPLFKCHFLNFWKRQCIKCMSRVEYFLSLDCPPSSTIQVENELWRTGQSIFHVHRLR